MNDGNLIKTKSCTVCGEEKPVEEFSNTRKNQPRDESVNREYYKHPQCKPCQGRGAQAVKKIKKDPLTPQPKKTCDNCGKEFKNKQDILLDHDHCSEKFRGWLCRRCNAGIGQLGDDIKGLSGAIIYLIKAKLKWYR